MAELAEKATKGKWELHAGYLIRVCVGDFCTPVAELRTPYRRGVGIVRGHREECANGQFLGAASNPAFVLALIREVKELRRKYAVATELVAQYAARALEIRGDSP